MSGVAKTPDPGATNGSGKKRSGRAAPSINKPAPGSRGSASNNDPFTSLSASHSAGNLFNSTPTSGMGMNAAGPLPFVGASSSKNRLSNLTTPPGRHQQRFGGPVQTPGTPAFSNSLASPDSTGSPDGLVFSPGFGTPGSVAFSEDLGTPGALRFSPNIVSPTPISTQKGVLREASSGEGGAENELQTANDQEFEDYQTQETHHGVKRVKYPTITDAELADAPGAYDPQIPQSLNNIEKYRLKTKGEQDPNGRVGGRKLVMWHRPRMMAKLILHLQYECFKGGILLPWDKVAHRMSPGSSGPAIIQYLNKLRDYLVLEGHMIPPNMGKSSIVHDSKIRGYIRDLDVENDPYAVKSVRWDDIIEDRKENLVVPGFTTGSGTYSRAKDAPRLPKPAGRRYRVPPEIKADMDKKREKRRPKNPGINGGTGIRKDGRKKREYGYENLKIESPEEVDPAELASDDDYQPGVTATGSTKRKTRAAGSGRRKKIRDDPSGSDLESPTKKSSLPVKLHLSPEALSKFPSGTNPPDSVGETVSSAVAIEENVETASDSIAVEDDVQSEAIEPSSSQELSTGDGGDEDREEDTVMAEADSRNDKKKISLPEGVHFAKDYKEFWKTTAVSAQGTGISIAQNASPAPAPGARPEDTEATLQSRDTPPPPYSQQVTTQSLPAGFGNGYRPGAARPINHPTLISQIQRVASSMNVELATGIAPHAAAPQNGSFYVPGSFANGPMFGNNQSSATLAGNVQLGPQSSNDPRYGVNAYGGRIQYPSGYPSTGYPPAYSSVPSYHPAPRPYSQYSQYQPNTNTSSGNAEQGDFGMGDTSFADFNVGNYQAQFGYGNGSGQGHGGAPGNPGFGRRQ